MSGDICSLSQEGLNRYLTLLPIIRDKAIDIAKQIMIIRRQTGIVALEDTVGDICFEELKDKFFSPEVPILMCSISYYLRRENECIQFPANYLYEPRWIVLYDLAARENEKRFIQDKETAAVQKKKLDAEQARSKENEEYNTYLKLEKKYGKKD
jgi:hypothetical protein